MHHIDEATRPEDCEKARRDLDAAKLTVLDPDVREILADLSSETEVPSVVFINAAVF